jgi:hypothetical protein
VRVGSQRGEACPHDLHGKAIVGDRAATATAVHGAFSKMEGGLIVWVLKERRRGWGGKGSARLGNGSVMLCTDLHGSWVIGYLQTAK